MANGTLKVSNIQTSSGSGTITLGQSGETVTVASGVTQTVAVNTPAFLAKPAVAATISDNTLTKVSFTEVLDTASGYDGSRFTPGVAGYYQVNALAEVSDGSNGYGARIIIYKNGSADNSIENELDGNAFLARGRMAASGVIYLDADDYIEVYVSFNTVSGDAALGTEGQFSAYKIIQ